MPALADSLRHVAESSVAHLCREVLSGSCGSVGSTLKATQVCQSVWLICNGVTRQQKGWVSFQPRGGTISQHTSTGGCSTHTSSNTTALLSNCYHRQEPDEGGRKPPAQQVSSLQHTEHSTACTSAHTPKLCSATATTGKSQMKGAGNPQCSKCRHCSTQHTAQHAHSPTHQSSAQQLLPPARAR
jgi:hypothetical protein